MLIAVLCVALVPLAAWLDQQAPTSGPGVTVAGGPGWPWAANGAVLGILAAIVLHHDPRQRFGWVLAGFALFWATDGLAQSYVQAGLTAESAWPAMTFALWYLLRFGAYLTAVVAVLLLVFPTGRLLPGAWRVASVAALVGLALSGAAVIVAPAEGGRAVADLPPGVDLDPTTIEALRGHGDTVMSLGVSLGVACFFFALLTVVVRYRRSAGIERDRMRWLLWSVLVIVGVMVLGAVFPMPVAEYTGAFAATVAPPAAMTVAIVRPTLVPIQDLLARTVVVTVVVAALVAADLAVLAALTALLDDDLTRAQVIAVVLAVAVLLYGPLRHRLSAAVRRRMLGERHDPYDALTALSAVLETTDDPAAQLEATARAVARAFAIDYVRIEVTTDADLPGAGLPGDPAALVGVVGTRPTEVRKLDVSHRGVRIGGLILPRRGLRARLSARDEELVADLVRQAVAAARTSLLAAEVQRSRQALVAAREEERRRIRRDLHDGLGPALSGMVFGLEAARLRLASDPEGAAGQLEVIAGQAQAVVGDVRRLVHDLRPPALDDRGLVGALVQQADRLGLELAVTGDLDLAGGPLPAGVEVAAYRIVGEALTNVARHAGSPRVRLHLARRPGHLEVEVIDDGRGITPQMTPGVGLLSQRERARELGGSVRVTSTPGGGTTVRACLPLGADASPGQRPAPGSAVVDRKEGAARE